MNSLQKVLSAIGDSNYKQRGDTDTYYCKCPAHDDGKASLSVTYDSRLQSTLINCHANCSTIDVLNALGLKFQDLYDDPGTTPPAPAQKKKATRHATHEKAIAAVRWSVEQNGETVAETIPYLYENGQPFGYNVRFNFVEGGKTFRQIHRDGDAWLSGAGKKLWCLYRLNDIPADGVIHIHEGEKACDAGVSCGLPSTACKGGSKAPKQSDWSPLAGREVVIHPDNDEPGEGFAAEVTTLLHALDPPAVVRVVRLKARPPEGGDLADVVADCQDNDELIGLRQEIEDLVAATDPEKVPQVTIVPAPVKTSVEDTAFPTGAFPEDIKNFIEQSAASICCEPVMVAGPLLSSMATLAGGINSIRIKSDWVEPLIIWTMTVTDSGSKKSPAFKAALAPLEAIETQLEEENIARQQDHKIRMREYESDLAIWKGRKRDASKTKKGGVPTPFTESPPVEPEKYCDKCVILSDVTIEALGWVLENNSKGVLLAIDEASSWLNGFDRYGGGGEVGKWLELHSGGRIRTNRVERGRKFVKDPRLSVAGGIQPWVLSKAIGQEHVANGLLQRFLVAQPKKVKRSLNTPSVDFVTTGVMTALFEDMRVQAINQDGLNDLQMSPEAFDLFAEFYARHADKQHAAEGAEAGMLAKVEAAAARLAGVLFTAKTMLSRTDGFGDVDAESVAGGIALAEWYAAEWERLYRGHIVPEADPDDVLLDYLAKHGGKVKRTDVMRGPRRYRTADILDQALLKLKSRGLIAVEYHQPESGAGRGSEWISLTE